jgi:hypothetical protein
MCLKTTCKPKFFSLLKLYLKLLFFPPKRNKFSDSLLAVDSLAKKINVQIPIKVIEYDLHFFLVKLMNYHFRKVDEGKNPDIVTKEYFEDCRKKNDQARGRALCTKVFQEQFKSRLEAWNASLPV